MKCIFLSSTHPGQALFWETRLDAPSIPLAELSHRRCSRCVIKAKRIWLWDEEQSKTGFAGDPHSSTRGDRSPSNQQSPNSSPIATGAASWPRCYLLNEPIL